MKATSKLFQATEIVKVSESKAEALDAIVKQLGVTRSNAFVYYTKATKGVAKPAKAEKAEKTESKTSVSMTSASKKAAKLAEIDAFLASNKSAVGNPFAALGA